ncbi:MAG: tetratricopeptide repeat protein [Magnetococcales bacterium]|nr:tetratricopeptide repeat protein [Magnetococcales bacterium]
MRLFIIFIVGFFALFGATAPAHSGLMDDIYKLTDQKQYDAAMDKLNQYLEKKPKDAQARFLKGLVLTEQGKRDKAITIFQALSKDYPDLPEPYNNLAVLYAEKGQYDQARDALAKAIKSHPTYATAHENMGDIYAKMASKSYRKAISLSGSNKTLDRKLEHIKLVLVPGYIQQHEEASSEEEPVQQSSQPVAEIEEEQDGSDDVEAVEMAVEQWAAAWTSLNINDYLNSYSKKFRPPAKFPNYSAWVQNRKRVIGKAKTIKVTYKGLNVTFLKKDLARAEFEQNYWSPNYKDKVNKTLTLARENGAWKIVWERSDG